MKQPNRLYINPWFGSFCVCVFAWRVTFIKRLVPFFSHSFCITVRFHIYSKFHCKTLHGLQHFRRCLNQQIHPQTFGWKSTVIQDKEKRNLCFFNPSKCLFFKKLFRMNFYSFMWYANLSFHYRILFLYFENYLGSITWQLSS